MDGPGRLGVSQPKPFVYASPAEIRLLLTKRERWIFNNHGVILTLIMHYFYRGDLDPNYLMVGTSIIFTVVIRSHASNLE